MEKRPKPQFIALFVIICVMLIAGIIATIVTAAIRKNPEAIALDAVSHLLNASNDPIDVHGSAVLKPRDADSAISAISISFDGSTAVLPNTLTADIKVALANPSAEEDGFITIDLEASSMMLKDGKIYFSFTGLTDTFNDAFESLGITSNYFDNFSEYSEIAALFDLVEFAEDEWWEIDLANFEIEDGGLLSIYAESLAKAYSCLVAATNSYISDNHEIVDAYSANRFLQISATGEKNADGAPNYNVSIDQAQLASFMTAVRGSAISNELATCIGASSDDLSTELTLTEPAELIVSIDRDRRITLITATIDDDAYAGSFSVKLSYPGSISVDAPSEYRPVSDLMTEVFDAIGY